MIDLDAIEARIRDCKTYNFGLWNADKLAHEDAPAMLTELRHLRVIAAGNQGAIVNSIIERTRHEPTDDEREAEVKSYSGWDADEVARCPRVAADVIEQLRTRLLDEFRRSEVPEPSAELTMERRHELVEGAVDAIEPNVMNRTAAYNTWNNLASDDRFVRAIVTFAADRIAEPKGEPSDGQVLAALNAYYGGKPPVSDAFKDSMSPNMRAALRAAGGVR